MTFRTADAFVWDHCLVDPSLVISVVAVGISGASLWVSVKQPFRTQRLSVADVAAGAIINSISDMRKAVWESAEVPPDPEVIAKLAYDVDRTCRAHHRALPRGLTGVRREVRAAVGNYLGGASGYTLDPGLKDFPFSSHQRYWWEISYTYLDYVVDTLASWRSYPHARHVDLTPFHEWRRDEDPYKR